MEEILEKQSDSMPLSQQKMMPHSDVSLSKTSGVHILAEFYLSDSSNVAMTDADYLKEFALKAVANSGLTRVGDSFYQFSGAGVTGIILLAESHVAIHTWPEENYVTLDVFVCNVSQDNSHKARTLYQAFYEMFEPVKVNYREVFRE